MQLGLSADLTKYPQEAHILFVVYDPDSAVVDRTRSMRDCRGQGEMHSMRSTIGIEIRAPLQRHLPPNSSQYGTL